LPTAKQPEIRQSGLKETKQQQKLISRSYTSQSIVHSTILFQGISSTYQRLVQSILGILDERCDTPQLLRLEWLIVTMGCSKPTTIVYGFK
jgi:hypothetical protein